MNSSPEHAGNAGGSLIEQWFETLVETSSAAIGVISLAENRYVRANAAMLELYGMTLEELLSADPFQLAIRITHPDELVAEQTLFGELAVGARQFYRLDKRFMRPDGTERWGHITLSGGFEPSAAAGKMGALRWATLHIVDIHEQKAMAETLERREAEFFHAQKIDALGRLAAGIAHDFHNLLTVITGHAELLKESARQPNVELSASEFVADLDAILSAADRAAGLTAQLLAHGRREPVTPRAFVLSELVANTQRLLQRTLGSHLETEQVLQARGSIFADKGQIGQVVMNLMLNARDALAEGGHIRLATRDIPSGDSTAVEATTGRITGEQVALIVADNGHGMTAEVQARMFEPFFTTRAERPGMQGNGLGLATVQRIVTEAGGQIVVESAVGKGTCVTICFPRVTAAPDAARPLTAPQRKLMPNSQRVLVIEDEASVRSLVSTVLLGAHYLVAVARDGLEGLRMLENEREPFQLIVTDLVMPRVGGVSLARQLHARGNPPRMLFISGYSDHTFAELMTYGQLLAKPFTPTQLLAAVERALRD